ncbi:MAG: hypothetical protein M3Y64_01830, partial [Gemmatimonadota bacterium]|nr:hypothetical protein [Gemmatimonadota bacterium]
MRGAVMRRELSAVALALLAAFLLGALILQHVPLNESCWNAVGVFGPVGTFARCVLVTSVGIPGAALIAIACLAVALRLFGHLADDSDAPQLGLLFAGVVALVPLAIGLFMGGEPTDNNLTGLWGSFVAYYLRKGLGPAGAWIVFVLCGSALTVATLRWNPIRMLIGPGRKRVNYLPIAPSLTLAERLAPSPDEMPAIESTFTASGARALLRLGRENGAAPSSEATG